MTLSHASTALDASLTEMMEELLAIEREERAQAPRTEGRIDWREVVNSSNDAFVAVDASGTVIEWSRKAECLFGWTRVEAIGMRLEDSVFPADTSGRDRGGLHQLVIAQSGKRVELKARRRDGVEIPVEVSVSTMRIGASFVFPAFIHDISRRLDLQTQLAHAHKLESIGQLSAGIAHEINTPTQYVGDNTRFVQESVEELLYVLRRYREVGDVIRRGGDPAEALAAAEQAAEESEVDYLQTELGEAIRQSLEGIDRVASIVRAMKEFSHPGASAKTPTDINAAIRNTVTVATNEWKYHAHVVTDFDPTLTDVPCLHGDFNQVILNLIVNAAHAIGEKLRDQTSAKGTISIRTRRAADAAEIVVSDDGVGIPPEILSRVFDPFFTTKEVGVGTGQGLSIARSVIVDRHGGTIAVTSVPGEGACFTIRLPLEAARCP